MANNVRINQLELTRYGHFTNRTLKFPTPKGGAPDIHIIHGPNEAGKSTISNAIIDFIFGIKTRPNYAFLHSQSLLEISANLQTQNGDTQLTRINKKLLDSDENLLDTQFIDTHNLSREDYIARFWLDDATLLQGGESILNNKGELGAALFAATTGLNNVSTQLEDLLKTTDEFYKPGKRSMKVKVLTDSLRAVRREIKILDASKSKWTKLKKAQSEAVDQLKHDRDNLLNLQTKQKRQEAIKSALISFKSWENNRTTLTTEDAAIPSHWVTDFSKYREQHQHLTTNIALFTNEIKQLNTRVEKSLINEQWATYKDELDQLLQSTQAYHQDQNGLTEAQHKLDALTPEVERRQQTLTEFPLRNWNSANTVSTEILDQVDPLIENWKSSEATLRQLNTSHEEITSRLTATASTTKPTNETPNDDHGFLFETREHLERLQSALEHGPSKDLLQEFKSQTDRLKDYEQQAIRLKANLASAGLNDSTNYHSLKVPSIDIIERCIEQKKALNTQLAALQENAQNEQSKINQAEKRLENLGHEKQDSDLDLKHSRDELFNAWKIHKAHVHDQATYAELGKSAQSLEALLSQYNNSVESHLKNAENSGQIIEILQAQKESTEALADISDDIKSTTDKLNAQILDHEKLLAGLPNLSFEDPATLKNWVSALSAWQEADRDKTAQQDRTNNCHNECVTYAEELEHLIRRVSPSASIADGGLTETLAEKVARANKLATLCEKAWDRHRVMANQLAELEQDLKSNSLRIEQEKNQQRSLQNQTMALLQSTWVESVSFDQLCQKWNELKAFSDSMREKQMLENRISTTKAKLDNIDEKSSKLTNLFLPDDNTCNTSDKSLSTSARLSNLNRYHEQQSRLHTESKQHTSQIQEFNEKLSKCQAEMAVLNDHLKPFQIHYGSDDLHFLQGKVDTAKRLQQLQEEQDRLEQTICDQLACASFSDAQAELNTAITELGVDDNNHSEVRQGMEETLTALGIEVQGADQQRTDSQAQLGDIERKLNDIALDEKLAQLRQQEADLEHELEDGVTTALKRRLGYQAIMRGLQHFRNQNQSGMLAAAKQAFTVLTGGRYTDLVTRPTAKNTEELIATRATGESVKAAEMSVGTRYQLYLALRIASYHEYRRHREPLPFIADDIFETFDEARTEHALNELANMGQYGQIMYFTHHRHVGEIAAQVVPNVNIIELA